MITNELEEIFERFCNSAKRFTVSKVASALHKLNPRIEILNVYVTDIVAYVSVRTIRYDGYIDGATWSVLDQTVVSCTAGHAKSWERIFNEFVKANSHFFVFFAQLILFMEICKGKSAYERGFFHLQFEHLNRSAYEEEYQDCMQQWLKLKCHKNYTVRLIGSKYQCLSLAVYNRVTDSFINSFCTCDNHVLRVSEVNPFNVYAEGNDRVGITLRYIDTDQHAEYLHRLLRKTIDAYYKSKMLKKWELLLRKESGRDAK